MVLNLVDPASVRVLVANLRTAAAQLGRACPRVAVWSTCAIDPGPAAIEQMRRAVVGYLAAPGYAEMFERAGYADLVAFARSRPHPTDLLARVPAELNGWSAGRRRGPGAGPESGSTPTPAPTTSSSCRPRATTTRAANVP